MLDALRTLSERGTKWKRKESIFHDLFVDLMIMNESVPYVDGIRHKNLPLSITINSDCIYHLVLAEKRERERERERERCLRLHLILPHRHSLSPSMLMKEVAYHVDDGRY